MFNSIWASLRLPSNNNKANQPGLSLAAVTPMLAYIFVEFRLASDCDDLKASKLEVLLTF